jgi:hypothetical protein
VTAILNVPGSGIVWAGVSDAFHDPNLIQKSATFLLPTDGYLNSTMSGTDPNEGPFVNGMSGYDVLGGSTSITIGTALQRADGSFLFLGSSQQPWTKDLVNDNTGPLVVFGDTFPSHALRVSTDANRANRVYYSYGHDPATSTPSTHVISSFFTGGDLTPDLGFVASATDYPGPLGGSPVEAYIVKGRPDLTSTALQCSCTNGYADCGESVTGFASDAATRTGDCGGTSSCNACTTDCGDGKTDGTEQDTDCGGNCLKPQYTPDHQPHACACLEGQCDDGNPCTTDSCDPQVGCQHVVVQDGTPNCSGGQVCISGSCQFDCSQCATSNECLTVSCDPSTGCSYPAKSDGTTCSAGFCESGTCTGYCQVEKCTTSQACQQAGCDPTNKTCTTSQLNDGEISTCGTGQVCFSGACKTPTYDQNVQAIVQKDCATSSGCHSKQQGVNCAAGICFATCYGDAVMGINGCYQGNSADTYAYQCMSDLIGVHMPPGCTTPGQSGCPTQDEINIVQAWAAAGAPADVNGQAGNKTRCGP